jgi:hypothetical protein
VAWCSVKQHAGKKQAGCHRSLIRSAT